MKTFTLLLPELMNNTKKITEDKRNVPHKTTFTLAEAEEKILSAKSDLYLQLRKSVIGSFSEYMKLQQKNLPSLLSNMLLDMAEIFKAETE